MRNLLISEKLFEFERKDDDLRSELGIGTEEVIKKAYNAANAPDYQSIENWVFENGTINMINHIISTRDIESLRKPDLSELMIRGIKDNNLNYVKLAHISGALLDFLLPSHITKKTNKEILEYLDNINHYHFPIEVNDAIQLILDDEYHIKNRDKFYSKILKHIPDDELDQYLSNNKREEKRGFKLYSLLKFVDDNNPRYSEMIKYMYDLIFGEGKYNPTENRGFYSLLLGQHYSIYLQKHNNLYSLSDVGKNKMTKLFNNLSPKMPRLFKK